MQVSSFLRWRGEVPKLLILKKWTFETASVSCVSALLNITQILNISQDLAETPKKKPSLDSKPKESLFQEY